MASKAEGRSRKLARYVGEANGSNAVRRYAEGCMRGRFFLFLFLFDFGFCFLHAEAVLLALTDAFCAKIQSAWVHMNSVRCECARVSVNE